jgi:hypothetical protein
MAYTETDLAAIRTARLRGVRVVQYADRAVTYSSDAEMRQVEEDITRALAATTRTRRKQTIAVSSKGF